MALTPAELTRYRELFPITRAKVYLNHAATSPLSLPAVQAYQQFIRERSELEGDNHLGIMEEIGVLRGMLGRLIGSAADRIALVPNTTVGLNIVASGLPWIAGDEILIPEGEFPANVYPYLNLKRRGVRVRFLPTPTGGLEPETLRQNITPQTKLVALSFVEYLSGFRHDMLALGQICRDNGIWFIVDGIQGTGAIPFDVNSCHIDALANGGHKWLMFPQGFGFCYISKRLQAAIQPAYLGWLGVERPDDFLDYDQELSGDARRYETGAIMSVAVPCAIAALELLFEIGIERIYSHLKSLTDDLIAGLENLNFRIYTNTAISHRSGIVTFYPEDRQLCERLFQYLMAQNIVVSLRDAMIRIAPHFYNTPEDIKFLLDRLRSFMQKSNKIS